MRRRDFLATSALAGAFLPVRSAFANVAPARRLLFVVNYGGWDPTRVFAPEFDSAIVSMERDAERGRVGDLLFVDHPARPSVRTFMENWASRSLILKGVSVPSVAHESCSRHWMTGSAQEHAPDWGAIVSGAEFGRSSGFADQIDSAVDSLSSGVSRAVTLSFHQHGWDTHANNDLHQSENFEALFSGLSRLMDRLAGTPASAGGTLADETVVVVLSEMGRTPQLNAARGKDHWPYTSLMVVGNGVTGGRVVGAYDAFHYGRKIDPESGEVDDNGGTILSSDVVGATLLALADMDGEEFLPGVSPIRGVLA